MSAPSASAAAADAPSAHPDLPPSASPHLGTLLSRLRPFQRTAFEFAVHGTAAPSPDGGGGKKRVGANRAEAYAQRSRGKNSAGANAVAGAGTGRILLGDEMGLGKTLTSLAIMLAYQRTEWPLLILCPASLRYTWPGEIEKFCPWIPSQSIHVVRGSDDVHFAKQIYRWRNEKYAAERRGEQTKKCPVQIAIVTYSLLQNRFQIANALRDCEFECIIADESHNLKQSSSQRCQLALPLLQGSKRLVLLSGTPALNRPVELWPQLNALDAKGKMFDEQKGMHYTEYTKRFCNARRTRFGWDTKGVSNADELHACLKKVMIRRLKNDVLHDLPAKQRSIVPVSISDKEHERTSRETMMALGAARQALSEITDLDADDVASSAQWEARKLLMAAYQASGIAKAPATTEFILDWLDGSEGKLVVFAHHKDVLNYIEDAVAKRYKGRMGMIRIDGSVPPAERALAVKKFQTNKNVRLSLLSMTAAGVGLTLTAASNIVFAELHWTPGVLAQAEDRCHRIGQASSVNVMYCICKDEEVSVDMNLWSMLARKVGNLGRVVDGERAKLNAVEKDNDSSSNGDKKQSSGSGKGASVEDELSSFFAKSNVSSSSSKQSKGPIVRGTIQSFFSKQAKSGEQKKKSASSGDQKLKSDTSSRGSGECISLLDNVDEPKRGSEAAPAPKTAACISLLDDEDEDDIHVVQKKATSTKRPHHAPKKSSVVFVCQICTFENRDDVAACVMCNRPRTETDLQKPNEKVAWSCDACTFENDGALSSCEMCGKARLTLGQNDVKGRRNGQADAGGTYNDAMNICDDERDFDDDEEWDEEDLAAIDLMTQSHANVSQSPSSVTSTSPSTSSGSQSGSTSKSSEAKASTPEILSFSVSLNSGRVAIHALSSGQPLHINFEIPQLLTKESAEKLEESQLLRKANSSVSQSEKDVSFDDGAVKQVLAAIDENAITTNVSPEVVHQTMCTELKNFVRSWLGLREAEKKVVKERGEAIASSSLKQTVAKLLVTSISGTIERYQGGAKERAILNARNSCATAEDNAVLSGKACAWCAKPLLCAGGTYCSQSCVEDGRLRRGGLYSSSKIRQTLFALEHGKCQKCNLDAHALFTKMKALQPAERLNALLNAKWKLPKTRQATDRLLNDPQEHDFWQADHEIAVAEGGGSTGLDNLRTLCTVCHGVETEKLLTRLKTLPDPDSASDGRIQMNIFSAFSNMSTPRCANKPTKDALSCDGDRNNKRRKRRRMAD